MVTSSCSCVGEPTNTECVNHEEQLRLRAERVISIEFLSREGAEEDHGGAETARRRERGEGRGSGADWEAAAQTVCYKDAGREGEASGAITVALVNDGMP